MSKILGLNNWDLSAITLTEQTAHVVVLVAYPKVTEELTKLVPKERPKLITQQMRNAVDNILGSKLLTDPKLLKSLGQRGRYHGVQGEVRIADLSTLAALESVDSIRVESTNGRYVKLAQPRRSKSFFCVKMTVAIQVEGQEQGMQTYEERYVLFKTHMEEEALSRAKTTASTYGEPYLNSSGLLVRWKVESLDDVYEVIPASGVKGFHTLDEAEVFSVLKSRKITAARAWLRGDA